MNQELAVLVAAVVGSLFGTGFIVALFKLRPDVRLTNATAAKAEFETLRGIIETMQKTIDRQETEIEELRGKVSTFTDLSRRVVELENCAAQLSELIVVNQNLARTNENLRTEINTLRKESKRL